MYDNLGDRMKMYEDITRTRLLPRIPVLIRVDGKAFHTLTKGMKKPLDHDFQACMWHTAKHMCENVQGAQVAYVQSDEISLLLTDFQTQTTQGWFDYNLLKVTSVSASMATAAFNYAYRAYFPKHQTRLAYFDSRTWSLPLNEVNNYFIWRQQDATRNSISSLAQANFSHKQLQGLSSSELQELLFKEKKINWNDCPIPQKRGVCIVRETSIEEAVNKLTGEKVKVERSKWVVDQYVPIFSTEKNYINKFLEVKNV